MARFKPAGNRKVKASEATSKRGLVSCVFLLAAGMAIVAFLFYLVLQSG